MFIQKCLKYKLILNFIYYLNPFENSSTGMHNDNSLNQFWFSTTFQNVIEVSLQLSNNPAPEETPYVYKYQAITKLKTLIEKEHPYHFLVHTVLGEIYNDVDQLSDSVRSYELALIGMSKLDEKDVPKFYTNLIVVYNMLGISYINRQQIQQGMGCLAKAIDIYNKIQNQKFDDVYHNRADEPRNRQFRCYYQGGVNKQQLQNSHTLSLFYLAQCYTKLGFKEKAAINCGLTLQRQYATNKFQTNDFCHNLISLSEYYDGNKNFAQALYLLIVALEILPEGKKKKMRAKIKIALGSLESRVLQSSIQIIKNKKTEEQIKIQNEKANKSLLLFEKFKQKAFPKVEFATDLEQCKSFFRKALTQYKEAIQVFVLDGYVTQHIDILFAMSKLYHHLCKIDKSRERVSAMLEKRRQILEPLLKQLNNKAYPATWQKILVEVSQIYNDLFQLKTLIATDIKPGKQISDEKLKGCCALGNQLIEYYKLIIKELQDDKQAEKNAQYYRSIINSKFNIAKTLSKMYSLDTKQRVEYLRQSWYKYKEVAQYIKKTAQPKDQFQKQLELTNEMIAMLPNKIDRINWKQVSPFE